MGGSQVGNLYPRGPEVRIHKKHSTTWGPDSTNRRKLNWNGFQTLHDFRKTVVQD
jgi:hypothetical protein